MRYHGFGLQPRYEIINGLFPRIRSELARSETAATEWLPRRFDPNGSGYLDRREVERFIREFQPDITFRELQLLLEPLERARPGFIGANEFFSLLGSRYQSAAQRHRHEPRARSAPMGHRHQVYPNEMQLSQDPHAIRIISIVAASLASSRWTAELLFQKLDLDGNGTLGSYEMGIFLRTILPDLSPSECSSVFAYFDTNASGRVGIHDFCIAICGRDRLFHQGLGQSDALQQDLWRRNLSTTHDRPWTPTREQGAYHLEHVEHAFGSPLRRPWPPPDVRLSSQSVHSAWKTPLQHERYPFSVPSPPRQSKPTSSHRGKSFLDFNGIDAFKVDQGLRVRQDNCRHEPSIALEEAAVALTTEDRNSRASTAKRFSTEASQALLAEFGKPAFTRNEGSACGKPASLKTEGNGETLVDFALARRLHAAGYNRESKSNTFASEYWRRPISSHVSAHGVGENKSMLSHRPEEYWNRAQKDVAHVEGKPNDDSQLSQEQQETDDAEFARRLQDEEHRRASPLKNVGSEDTQNKSYLENNSSKGYYDQVQADAEFALKLQEEELCQASADKYSASEELPKWRSRDQNISNSNELPQSGAKIMPINSVEDRYVHSTGADHGSRLSNHVAQRPYVEDFRSTSYVSPRAFHATGLNMQRDYDTSSELQSGIYVNTTELQDQLQSDRDLALKLHQDEMSHASVARSTNIEEPPDGQLLRQETHYADTIIAESHVEDVTRDAPGAKQISPNGQEHDDAEFARKLQEEEQWQGTPQTPLSPSPIGNLETQIKQPQDRLLGNAGSTSPLSTTAHSKQLWDLPRPGGHNYDNFEVAGSHALSSGKSSPIGLQKMNSLGKQRSRAQNGLLSSAKEKPKTRGAQQLHREKLVEDIYKQEGLDLNNARKQARQFLKDLGLTVVDAGSINAAGYKSLKNQCFYLSLARSYLGPSDKIDPLGHSDKIDRFALLLKQVVEYEALSTHPAWADGVIGSEVQAFSDFLWYPMRDKACFLSEFAAAIMDSTTGWIELFKGVNHDAAIARDSQAAMEKFFMLWHVPGHYQCLTADDAYRSKPSMSLSELKRALDQRGVAYVETTE